MIRGFACGVFDLYHPGHVMMLKECRAKCDHLTIAINRAEAFSDEINPGKRKPIFTPDERQMVLESIRYVDATLFYSSEAELAQIMSSGGFDLRFLGGDYRGKAITAPEAIPTIVYLDRGHGYSTTSVLQRIVAEVAKSGGS